MIVLNAEPNGYSEKAIDRWKQKGYTYKASGWKEIESSGSFEGVNILIVRLARKIDKAILNKFPGLIINDGSDAIGHQLTVFF